MKRKVWAYVRKSDGRITVDTDLDEDNTWRIMLGWPTRGEVKWHKEQGDRVVRAEIHIPDEGEE